MSTPVKHKITILQGTTQRIPLSRQYVPYAIKGDACSGYVDACTGAPVPPTDFHDEDYTGCSALLQIRADIGEPVLWEMSTTNGRIELDGKTLTLVFDADDSSAFTFYDGAMGQVEVTRSNGDVERHYALTFTIDRESTI